MDTCFNLLAIGEPTVEFNQTGGAGSRQCLQGFGGDTWDAAMAASGQGARCAYFTHMGDDPRHPCAVRSFLPSLDDLPSPPSSPSQIEKR